MRNTTRLRMRIPEETQHDTEIKDDKRWLKLEMFFAVILVS